MHFRIDGAALRAHREEMGLSRESLASAARVAASTIKALETNNGRGPSKAATVENLARALMVSPGDLAPDYAAPPSPYLARVAYDPTRLKNLRSERGLTVADVARRSGLSPFCVGNLEKKTSATPNALRKVARVYAVPVEEVAPALAAEVAV